MKKITPQLFIFLIFTQLASCQDKKAQDISIIPSQYKNLPILSSPINDSIYMIEKVVDGNFSRIFFDNVHQFYVIENGENNIVKLDKNGIKTFELNLHEQVSYPSYYILASNGIYDLSKDKPSLEKFSSIINTKNELNEDGWENKFNELYTSSEIVIFGYRYTNYYGKRPIYFRKNNGWTLLYETGHKIRTEGYQVKCKIDNKFVLEKYQKMYILKDSEKNIFSDGNDGVENPYKDENDESSENKMEYKPRMQLTTTAFYKYRDEQGNPESFVGKSINKLSIDGHNIFFNEIAIKNIEDTSKICENFMYLFDIPTQFQADNSVGFLFYQFPFSWSNSGDDYSGIFGKIEGVSSGEIEGENSGVYVIRKKIN